jgi:hypothetical protein
LLYDRAVADKKLFNLWMDKEDRETLRAYAKQMKVSMADVVRMYIKSLEPLLPKKGKK